MHYVRAAVAARRWRLVVVGALCPRGHGRVLVPGLVRVRHGRGPTGRLSFQVADHREAMVLFSPTIALYPGSDPTHLIQANMELEQQFKPSDGVAV
jgi:hypothetical protein